ncbi:MAG: GNAT family N-acetyltransferase [Proteobacteria bacterium]|nr:GNAT family N-acetyltransferase [Pseudomonadota bacterium]
MIRSCRDAEIDVVWAIINDAAEAYRGVIPADRWHQPYMSRDELRGEIAAGVDFLGFEEDGELIGIMGTQPVKDVTLIRHAYVRTSRRRGGIGAALLAGCLARTPRPVLIGTWAAASWAISFYQKHGFRVIDGDEKNGLLKTYWSIPERQIETSVVLADQRWTTARKPSE